MALKGIKVIELAGLAPVPMCGMILRDFGARVIRVDSPKAGLQNEALSRGKESILLDLKRPDHTGVLRKLCSSSDVLLDPFRPGVLERLSLAPDSLLMDNPRLIVARLTGYGQPIDPFNASDQALSGRAGHDINYLSQSGLLSMLGRHPTPPTFPVNLLADFAGGALPCALGIALALVQRSTTQRGQIIDASMTEGAAYLSSFLWTSRAHMPHLWPGKRGCNPLDGGMHFYRVYSTSDNGFMAVGAIEPQFYANLLAALGLDAEVAPQFCSPEDAVQVTQLFETTFASRTRDEWTEIFKNVDACVTPVLSMEEASSQDIWNRRRDSFMRDRVSDDDNSTFPVPRPAPRLSEGSLKQESMAPRGPISIGVDTTTLLKELGYSEIDIATIVTPAAAKAKL